MTPSLAIQSDVSDRRWLWHLLALLALAFPLQLLFLQIPRFGDDLTYWSFAFELQERGLKAWSQDSFHNLRWPVWGMAWIFQRIFGPGFASFWGIPILYVSIGAALTFLFARMLTGSLAIAWISVLAFTLHPLLDTVCYRPMPDVSEAVLGAAVMYAWWRLMQAGRRGSSIGWAIATGLLVFITESNRLTGIFIVPVLLVCTLMYFRRQFGWLVLAGGVAALFYAGEMAFYQWLFQDPLHSIHANLGGSGRKGTEAISFFYLPFRFLNTLWQDNLLAPLYFLAAAYGGWVAWKRHGILGRVIVLWFVVLYLTYSMAPQSIWPWRPIVRDADRFLAGLSVPMSLLAAIGLVAAFSLPPVRRYGFSRWLVARPAAAAALGLVIALVGTSRKFTSLEFAPAMREYVNSLPAGTKVFTHEELRPLVFLVAPEGAQRIQWLYKDEIIPAAAKDVPKTPALEKLAAQADEFWYARKLVWLRTRKNLENDAIKEPSPLPTYFTETSKAWKLSSIFVREDATDIMFYKRRPAGAPAPLVIEATDPALTGVVPTLPIRWKKGEQPARPEVTWKLPENVRGKLVRLEMLASSKEVESFTTEVRLKSGGKELALYRLKPYLHPKPAWDYFGVPVPADADTCDVRLVSEKGAKEATLENLRLVVE